MSQCQLLIMETGKDEGVILLSMTKPIENNNTLASDMLNPFEYELNQVKKEEEKQVKRRTRIPLIIAWVCVGCAVIFAIAAVVLILHITRSVEEEVSGNNTSISPAPVTPASSSSHIVPSPTTVVPLNNSTSSSNSSVPTPLPSSSVNTTARTSVSSTNSAVHVTDSIKTDRVVPVLATPNTSSSVLLTPSKELSTDTGISPTKVTEHTHIKPVQSNTTTTISVVPTAIAIKTVAQTTPKPGCMENEFTCASGECVPSRHRCDGSINCQDTSDEINCPDCQGFECASGLCLWRSSVQCDMQVQCPDLSDEMNCAKRSGYYQCRNGLQVPADRWCDGVDNCFDNSDEEDCDGECNLMGERVCGDMTTCMMHTWWCDGHYDCPGASDELMCGTCGSDQYECSDHTCIDQAHFCDGNIDCSLGDDEFNDKCVQLSAPDSQSGLTGLVTVLAGDDRLPVCSDNWSHDLSDAVCQQLGHGTAAVSKEVDINSITSGVTSKSDFLNVDSDAALDSSSETVLAVLKRTLTCPTQKVISITCQPQICGERKMDFMTPFIVGGNISPVGRWPWVASLSLLGNAICGGVLVGNQWVLTAGHCIVDGSHDYTQMPRDLEVILGTTLRTRHPNDTAQRIKVDRIVTHPSMTRLVTGVTDWDMALLHLSRPVVYGKHVQPVCLTEQGEDTPTNSQCYLAGWGFINPQEVTVEELRDAKMRVWSKADCGSNTVAGETHVNTNSTLCAGYWSGLISACQGDSGGPLMCEDTRGRWSVAGVMSSGSNGCDGTHANRANRFAKVSSSADWIDGVIHGG